MTRVPVDGVTSLPGMAICTAMIVLRPVPPASFPKHTVQHRYVTEQKNRLATPAQYEPQTFAYFLALRAIPADYSASD